MRQNDEAATNTDDKPRTVERLENVVESETTRPNRGVPAGDLDDEQLRQELHNLYRTRADTLMGGSAQAFETHTQRMLELERAYIERFGEAASPDPGRTREGSRARAGQDASTEKGEPRPISGGQDAGDGAGGGEGKDKDESSRQGVGQRVDDYGATDDETSEGTRERLRDETAPPRGTRTAEENPNAATGSGRDQESGGPESESVPASRPDIATEQEGARKKTDLPHTRPPSDS